MRIPFDIVFLAIAAATPWPGVRTLAGVLLVIRIGWLVGRSGYLVVLSVWSAVFALLALFSGQHIDEVFLGAGLFAPAFTLCYLLTKSQEDRHCLNTDLVTFIVCVHILMCIITTVFVLADKGMAGLDHTGGDLIGGAFRLPFEFVVNNSTKVFAACGGAYLLLALYDLPSSIYQRLLIMACGLFFVLASVKHVILCMALVVLFMNVSSVRRLGLVACLGGGGLILAYFVQPSAMYNLQNLYVSGGLVERFVRYEVIRLWFLGADIWEIILGGGFAADLSRVWLKQVGYYALYLDYALIEVSTGWLSYLETFIGLNPYQRGALAYPTSGIVSVFSQFGLLLPAVFVGWTIRRLLACGDIHAALILIFTITICIFDVYLEFVEYTAFACLLLVSSRTQAVTEKAVSE